VEFSGTEVRSPKGYAEALMAASLYPFLRKGNVNYSGTKSSIFV
jgi:hypothetical protein